MLTEIPKVMNLYWDKGSMSYLQYMTVISFNKHNPDWKIVIYEPKNRYGLITWDTDEQRIKYSGKDYYKELINKEYVEIKEFNFDKLGFIEETPEVYKSDFIRWYILSTEGGGWSDFDILYIKPIIDLDLKNEDTIICFNGNVHIIGFYLSSPNNEFFKNILKHINKDFDKTNYQSIGSTLLTSLYPNINKINDLGINHLNLSMDCLYPYKDYEISKLFSQNDISNITEKTIGIHWYNGSRISKLFNNSFNPENNNIENSITSILKLI